MWERSSSTVTGRDAQGVVGFGFGRRGRLARPSMIWPAWARSGSRADRGLGQRQAAELQEIAPLHDVPLLAGRLTCILSRSELP